VAWSVRKLCRWCRTIPSQCFVSSTYWLVEKRIKTSLSVITNLVNLVFFFASDNLLEGELVGSLPLSLEELTIDGNHVTGVRLAGRGLPAGRLVRLTMSFNSLTELPVLSDAPQLSLLDATNNYISVVRDASFTCCRMLQQNLQYSLSITNNRLRLSVKKHRSDVYIDCGSSLTQTPLGKTPQTPGIPQISVHCMCHCLRCQL